MPDPGRTIDKTHLSIDQAEDRGFLHRDYIAHCLRWSHVVKHLQQKKRYKKARILDIGCGKEMPLIKTLYTMKMTPKEYIAIDINKIKFQHIHEKILEKMKNNFRVEDLQDFSQWDHRYKYIAPTLITCFEVLEHNTPANVVKMLSNIWGIADDWTTIFISTPCFNGKAAANHINEMTYEAMETLLKTSEFEIIHRWGTFASQKDIEPVLYETGADKLTMAYEFLKNYYDSNLLSVMFAPLFPRNSRNVLWEVKKIHVET